MASFTVPPPGYRLPDSLHLGVVKLQVADVERSIAYYDRVIGLRVLRRDGGVAELAPHGEDVSIVELHEHEGATSVPRRGRLGLYHFAILLPDRVALGRFVAHLAEIGERVGMADHLVSEALYLTDPDGLGIEVYADRPRDTWRTSGNVLAMATDPLDIDDLVRAGGNEKWRGMPLGTRIGHVHLYVDSLETAESFYHRGLGLDKIVLQFPGALFMSAGGYHHHLGTNIWAAQAPRAGADDARLLEWTLYLGDRASVDAAAKSLALSGHDVSREDGAAVATDPWGTAIRLAAE